MIWQPIDSAPKDGTAILVSSNCRVGESSWGICLRQNDGYIANERQPCWRSADGLKLFPGIITHWMPLPAPHHKLMDDNTDDSPPIELATIDQIFDELSRRSIGCVVACLLKMTDNEEHFYACFHGRTVALGLCERIQHQILNLPNTAVGDDEG